MTTKKQSFRKTERLNKSLVIRSVRYHGKRLSFGNLSVSSHPNEAGFPRLAIALTTKCGSSVVRNRIRRRIREFFRKNKHKLGGYDFFFYSSRDLTSLDTDDFKKIFQHFLKWHPSKK